MRESNKKSKSRQLFEKVFEQQTRRFSAFDLLGLSANTNESQDTFKDEIKPTELARRDEASKVPLAALDGHSHIHRPDSHTLGQSPDQVSTLDLLDSSSSSSLNRVADVLGDDGKADIHGPDLLQLRELDQRSNSYPNPDNSSPTPRHTEEHGADGPSSVLLPDRDDQQVFPSQSSALSRVIQTKDNLSARSQRRTDDQESGTQEVDKQGISEFSKKEMHPYTTQPSISHSSSLRVQPSSTVSESVPSDNPKSEAEVKDARRANLSKTAESYPIIEDQTRTSQELYSPGLVEQISIDSPSIESQSKGDNPTPDLGPDGHTLAQTVDGLGAQTPDRLALGMTVWSYLGQTLDKKSLENLGPDGHTLERPDPRRVTSILLAPVQWAVWEALLRIEAHNTVTSYREIAKMVKSTVDGVRKAIRVLERERGIVQKETVRTAQIQGFRFKLNHAISFHKGTINQAKAILKRGIHLAQTPDRASLILGPDRLRMFVCKNINIKQTDIVRLLSVTPRSWAIREQTLIQIAELLPDMTAIEFRLSLAYLIEQAKTAKQPVRNHNAWVKAAFEKCGAPLVTERDIEAQFSKSEPQKPRVPQDPPSTETEANEEIHLLRLYLSCPPEDKIRIDEIAEQKAAPLLKVVSTENRDAVLQEARVEAVRAFFSSKQ